MKHLFTLSEWLKDKWVGMANLVMPFLKATKRQSDTTIFAENLKSLKSLMSIFAGNESYESTERYRVKSRIPSCLFRYSLDPNLSRLCLASLICVCMLTVGSGNVWGAEGDEHEYTNVAFSQLLNNSATISNVTITDPGYPVKKIVANCRYNKTAGGVTISITIGGNSFGTNKTHNANSTEDLEFTDDAMTGDIVLSFTNNCGSGTGKGTFYLNSVTLVEGPAAAPSCTAPSISAHPSNATYSVGDTPSNLSVTASGTSLTYQWYSNTTATNTGGTSIPSATNSTYSPSTASNGTFYYYCVVSSSSCTTTSNVATITVNKVSATVTLNNYSGDATTTGLFVGESFTLPSTNSYTCGSKTFVGWSTIEVAETDTKPSSNFYEPGASVTLAASNTFYAVFAKAGGSAGTEYVLTAASAVNAGTYIIAAYDAANSKYVTLTGGTTTASGKTDLTNESTGVTLTNNKFTTAPTGACEFTLAGTASDGFTIKNADATGYLGYTAQGTSRSLAFGNDYSTFTWKVVELEYDNYTTGCYIHRNLSSNYTISTNGSSTTFIRGYSGSAKYKPMYFFKKTSTVTYTKYSTNCCTELGSINGSVSVTNLNPAEEGKLKASWQLAGTTGIGSLKLQLWKKGSPDAQVGEDVNVTVNTTAQTHTFTGLDHCETYYAKLIATKDAGTYCTDGWTEPSNEATTIGYAITISDNGEVYDDQVLMGIYSADKANACSGETVTLTALNETDYHFASWSVTKTNGGTAVDMTGDNTFTMPAEAVTVAATFESDATPIGIAFTPNANATLSATVGGNTATEAYAGETVTLACTDITSGYQFVGWTVTAGGDPVAVTNNTFTMPSSAVTVAADVRQTVTVTFKRDGSVYDTKSTYSGGTVTFPSNTPSKFDNDYPNFIGWADAISGIATSAPTLKSASDAITANAEYHAVFANAPQPVNSYEKVTTTGDLANNCKYVIAAWDAAESKYYAATGSLTSNGYNLDKENITSKVSNNIVTAPANSEVWKATIADNKVQFQNVGNSKYMSAVVNDNHTNFTLTENTGEQYTYSVSTGAWTFTTSSLSNNKQIEYYDDSGKDYFSYYTAQDAPIYLFKQQSAYTEWVTKQIVKHTISYNKNTEDEVTGSLPANATIVDDEDYTVSDATLSRDGYNFIGWNTSNTATTAQTTLSNVTADVTLYAVWEQIPTYNIEFSVNGTKVEALKLADQLEGTAIVFPDAAAITAASAFPTTDKKFVGWIEASSYASDDAPTFVTAATATTDKTYYAVFADVIGDDVVDEYDNDLTFPFALWENTNSRGAKNNSEAWQMYGAKNSNPEGEINTASAYSNLVSLGFNAKTGSNNTTLTIYYSADKSVWTELTTKDISQNTTYSDYSIDLSAIPAGAKYIKVKNSTNSFYIKSITLTQGAISDYVTNISPLSSIAITTAPTKTVYKKGEMLNLTSMVVTATYENERTRAVTNYTVTPNTTTALATTDVSFTVSYTEGEITKTATQNISVLALDNIAVTTPPTKTTYQEGESFDKAGMVVKATWGTGANKIEENLEANAYTVTPSPLNSTDITSVTISYTDDANDTETTTQTVTVNERPNLVMTWNVAGETTTSKIYINGDEQYLLALPEEDPEVPEAFGAGYAFIGWTSANSVAKDGSDFTAAVAGTEMTVATEFHAVFAQVNAPFFKETFDDCEGTGGNDGSWSGTIASSTVYTDNDNWSLTSAGGADKCIKLGAGSTQGSAQTPSFSLTGSATLTFKAGAWNSSNEKTTLNISATGATLKQNDEAISSVTMTKGAWTTYTVDVTDATGTVTIKFEANSKSDNRFFLDEVLVKRGDEEYKDYRFVPSSVTAPVIGLAEATYYGAQNATITQSQSKQIFYSLDGNTWTEYTAPVALDQAGSVTLYAKAYDESEDDYSSVVSKSYTIVTEIADPEITPSKAFYGGSMEVEISHELSGTEGFTLQYSYDGENYVDYTTALTITEDKTVYAKATIGSLEAIVNTNYTVGRFVTYWRVTDASQLRAGQRAIIAQHVSADGDVQVMDAQSGNNCGAKASTATNGGAIITPAFEAYAITLEAVEGGKFAFKVPGGYLYAASSSGNQLKVQSTNNANGQWKIEISNTAVATITAQGTATHNLLKYNSGSDLFSCYESGQTDVAIYVDEICTDINVSALEDNADVTVGNGATLTIDADDKPLNDITVKDGGTVAIENAQEANNLIVEAGGKVTGASNLTVVNDLLIKTSLGNIAGEDSNISGVSGEIANSNISATGDVFIEIELTQEAAASEGWYAFSVPFHVNTMNGVYYQNTPLQNEVGYAIMAYHEDERAAGKYAWKKYRETNLVPGMLYIITVGDTDYKTLRFKKAQGTDLIANTSVPVSYTVATGDGASGWNGVGNPNLQVSHQNDFTYLQFLDHDDNCFRARTAAKTDLLVGTAFMVQVAEATENITIATGANEGEGNIALAPARAPKAMENSIFEVKLRNTATGKTEDNLFLTAREDAMNAYEIGRDVTKMSMGTAKCAQMWVPAYGTQLCAADFPLVNDKAEYPLTITTPAAGSYRIEAAETYSDASLYLTKDGNIIWDLTMSPYEAEFDKGQNNGYGLMLVRKAPQVTTGVENVQGDKTQCTKVILNDHVYILRDAQLYDVTGKAVK